MRVGLVFNPFSYKLHEENLRIVQKYFGLFPPLSLAWVAGIARQAGHEVTLIDARTLRLSQDEVIGRLKEFQPDILGFMMTTYMFRETLEQWIRPLKAALKVPVMVGGYNLRVYPKESVTPAEIDFGCVNSAYYTVPALLKELEGRRRFADVPGLVYKRRGKLIQTPDHDPREDFDAYPAPARDLLPNELYAEFPTERKNFTVMVTSKGCPRRCLFCEAGGTPYNPRRPETVLREIEECYTRYGIREIDIVDYEFNIERERSRAICQGIIDRGWDISWACRSRVDTVDYDHLKLMRRAGCNRIYFGIEYGDQKLLDIVQKGITLKKVEETIRAARELGIRPLGFFLIGGPGETKATVNKTLKFAKKLKLDYVQFSKVTAKPLTQLWKNLVAESGYDYWREYILGNTEEKVLPRPWSQFSNEEIDRLARIAYLKYHARPIFLLRSTLKVKSFDEFLRKFLAFVDMVFQQEKISRRDPNFKAFNENFFPFRHKYHITPRVPT